MKKQTSEIMNNHISSMKNDIKPLWFKRFDKLKPVSLEGKWDSPDDCPVYCIYHKEMVAQFIQSLFQDEKKKWKEEVMERAGRMSEWVMKTEVIEMLEKI